MTDYRVCINGVIYKDSLEAALKLNISKGCVERYKRKLKASKRSEIEETMNVRTKVVFSKIKDENNGEK